MDRWLGNWQGWLQRFDIYRALATPRLSAVKPRLIVVDWSRLSADLQWHGLRAGVVVDGRSLTRYEEVHARKHLGHYPVHRRFVQRLAALLPPEAPTPIVITDAGFRGTWFQLLQAQGWHWIGRISREGDKRNREFVTSATQDGSPAKQLYGQATAQAQELGCFESARSNPAGCRLGLIKHTRTGRKHRNASA
ncbi:MAG: transposase [Burkholderiales bacterium]